MNFVCLTTDPTCFANLFQDAHLIFKIFLATPHDMWDPSSLTRGFEPAAPLHEGWSP